MSRCPETSVGMMSRCPETRCGHDEQKPRNECGHDEQMPRNQCGHDEQMPRSECGHDEQGPAPAFIVKKPVKETSLPSGPHATVRLSGAICRLVLRSLAKTAWLTMSMPGIKYSSSPGDPAPHHDRRSK